MASISKRTWRNPDGTEAFNWSVRWRDDQGKSRQRAFEKKKDADAYKQQVERERFDGVLGATKQTLTFADVCRQFQAHWEQRVADRKAGRARLTQIEQVLRNHVLPYFGASLRMTDLSFERIEGWSAYMVAKGNVSPRTRAAYAEILGQVEKFALKRGLTKKRIVSDFRSDMGYGPRPRIRTFTTEQIEQLLTTVNTRGYRCTVRSHALLRCAVHLAVFCGLRRGEIFGLRREHIDLERRVIAVRHSLSVFGELKGPKTASGVRDVPIPIHVAELLREWIDTNLLQDVDDLVFTVAPSAKRHAGGNRRFRMPNFVATHWHALLKRAGLFAEKGPQFHFHALRHFYASWLIANGMSLPDTAGLMGHSKFDLTLQIYAHPIIEKGAHRQALIDERASLISGAMCAKRVQAVPKASNTGVSPS